MRNKKAVDINVERIESSFKDGLSTEQVDSRVNQGLVNKTKMIAGKSVWEILRTDVLSFFNIVLFTIAVFMIYANVNDGINETKWYSGLMFAAILVSNIIIGLYQDLKAKHLMNKLKVITTPNARVIRNGQELEIKPSEIVLDDIVLVKAGEQIPSDCIILDGHVLVNESMLTGESHNIEKNVGDLLYSGSFLTSGSCFARVEKVGKENYIETLTEKAKSFKRNPSHILRSLKVLFRYLGVIVIGFAILTIVSIISFEIARKGYYTEQDFFNLIRPTAGLMVAMIPSGLYLLTSMALATGVVNLYRKRANVQDFYSIEMLARSDVICVDKTGTITDGNLSVVKVENLSKLSEQQIASIINSLVTATKDENATGRALADYFKDGEVFKAEKVLPFISDNKYSGISSESGETYLIGALEFMNIKDKDVLIKQSEEFTSKGYRLLALAKGKTKIKEEKYSDKVEIIGFIILQDHVKDDAVETFKWFQDNGVQVKVISGDNALTVSEVARSAGINGAEKYISLEGMSIEEVSAIANDYVVFGRVTPEQKEALVIALKENKHTVAMVGDGINDMLALKRADCSIAMNSGSLSARNVSHVVLMDDNFSTMPNVVAEGRRVINNLQRTGSLFLTKTIFAITMSFAFIIASFASKGRIVYPFSTNNLLLWETFGIGLSAFFIALEPDSKPIKKGFLRYILKNSVPSAALILTGALICFLLFVFQNNEVLYTGVSEFGFDAANTGAGRFGAVGMAVLLTSILSVFILFNTCRPLNLYRGIVVGVAGAACLTTVLICVFKHGKNVLNIDFDKFTGENFMAIAVIAIVLIAIALLVESLYVTFSKPKEKEEEKDEN